MRKLNLILLLSLLLCVACTGGGGKSASAGGGDLRYAKLLSISEGEGFIKVDVRTKENENPVATYLLVPRGSQLPSGLPEGEIIRTPVQSLVVNTSAYAYPMKELNALGVIKGVTDAIYFSMPEIQEGLKSGAIADVGSSQQPTVEKIVALQPDGILLNLYEGMNNGELPTVATPYIKLADNLEYTPLGRAEWIKFIGLLTDTEEKADSIFTEVEKSYNALAAKAKKGRKHPKVLVENMYQGIWYVPGGNSVTARLLTDAGASYPWKENKATGSLSLSFEEVLARAGDADLWFLKVYGTELDAKGLAEMDSRYTQLTPYKTGNVWYSNTKTSNLFDYTAFHPELLLRDYITIFNPELSDGKPPRFFKKMGE